MHHDFRFYKDDECEIANKQIDNILEDPMSKHYHCGGEISQEWLRKHVNECPKCKEATMLGNTP